MNINDILPARKPLRSICSWLSTGGESDAYIDGYNSGREDCADALSKHNLVVCPTEEELNNFISEQKVYYHELGSNGINWVVYHKSLAKALLALLHSKPQGVIDTMQRSVMTQYKSYDFRAHFVDKESRDSARLALHGQNVSWDGRVVGKVICSHKTDNDTLGIAIEVDVNK